MSDVVLILILVFVILVLLAILWSSEFGKKLFSKIFSGGMLPPMDFSGGASGTEYEAKFLDVDADKLREKLKSIGAKVVHDRRLYKRCAYRLGTADNPIKGFARVRDEGDKTTATVKIYSADSKYPEEHEVTLEDDFQAARTFMEKLGLEEKAYQETYREKYSLEGCNELAIDTIPGLAPYLEIDCKSEQAVFEIAEKLGFRKEDAHYGSFALTLEEVYGIPQKIVNEETPLLTFQSVDSALGKHVTKNKDKFDSVVSANK